jgi:hypothetical protein
MAFPHRVDQNNLSHISLIPHYDLSQKGIDKQIQKNDGEKERKKEISRTEKDSQDLNTAASVKSRNTWSPSTWVVSSVVRVRPYVDPCTGCVGPDAARVWSFWLCVGPSVGRWGEWYQMTPVLSTWATVNCGCDWLRLDDYVRTSAALRCDGDLMTTVKCERFFY